MCWRCTARIVQVLEERLALLTRLFVFGRVPRGSFDELVVFGGVVKADRRVVDMIAIGVAEVDQVVWDRVVVE